MTNIEFLKNLNKALIHFRAKFRPLNVILDPPMGAYYELAHQELSESVKKSIGGQKHPLMQIILFFGGVL